MDRLTIYDFEDILSLAIQTNCSTDTINCIKKFITSVRKKSGENRELTENEIQSLSSDKMIKFIMILFFLTKNVSLEFLRRKNKLFKSKSIIIKNIWKDIEEILTIKLLLSRDICTYFGIHFEEYNNINSAEFNLLLNSAKILIINDLSFEEFVNQSDSKIRLYITGKYNLTKDNSSDTAIEKNSEIYTLHDLKTCFHIGLYDSFKFEESQTWTTYRYLNNSPTKKLIDSVFTIKFSLPELTVLNNDGTFIKISAKDIPNFLENNLKNNEISLDLYQEVRKDYPKLFLQPPDMKTITTLYVNLKQLITQSLQDAVKVNKPLLILLSEVHGSKESFLFHTIILLIAVGFGIKHLLVETINIYHEKYGFDAQVTEIKRLISFAENDLGIRVKDLEKALHYKNSLCLYPYHGIPMSIFGIDAREASWIIDAKEVRENQIMIVGSGHLNNILNSELKECYFILPIDCTGDKDFSDMLSISQHNFITLDKSINHLSLDEIIKMVKAVVCI